MVGWYHQLDGHEFEQASGVGDGLGSLMRGSKPSQQWENLFGINVLQFVGHPPGVDEV